jgi:hypothetical protein
MIGLPLNYNEISVHATSTNEEEGAGSGDIKGGEEEDVTEENEAQSQQQEDAQQESISGDNGAATDETNACPLLPATIPSFIDKNGCPSPCPTAGEGEQLEEAIPEGCPKPTVPSTKTTTPDERQPLAENIAPTEDAEPNTLAEGMGDEEVLNESRSAAPALYGDYSGEVCDGLDNNDDGVIDQVQTSIGGFSGWLSVCEEGEICDDGFDNDNDDAVDNDDPECSSPFEGQPRSGFDPTAPNPSVEEQPPLVTNNQPEPPFKTAPGSGFDPMDSDYLKRLIPIGPGAEAGRCDDGVDNDQDGLTDLQDVDDCSSESVPSGGAGGSEKVVDRAPEAGRCDDGVDNDQDGLTDLQDVDDCPSSPPFKGQRNSGFNPIAPNPSVEEHPPLVTNNQPEPPFKTAPREGFDPMNPSPPIVK